MGRKLFVLGEDLFYKGRAVQEHKENSQKLNPLKKMEIYQVYQYSLIHEVFEQ